jgi:hypothetical protein
MTSDQAVSSVNSSPSGEEVTVGCGIDYRTWTDYGQITVTRLPAPHGGFSMKVPGAPPLLLFPSQAAQLATALSANQGDRTA